MPNQLTEQQQRTLDTEAQPPRVVDPRHSEAYVLIPLAEYEAVQEILEDERRQRALASEGLRTAARRLLEVEAGA
ncbi:MAG: hypothetical protein SF066_16165 [Thermoanaerobaculia bacterium]|nr:hypothetical protein [Thermoanaerobaculia bacterium]